MALEEQIVEWSKSRPSWQRVVLRSVATGSVLREKDYNDLIDVMVGAKPEDHVTFGLEQLPETAAETPPVKLVEISEPKHVNALASDQPLTFEQNGLTIVYGDNGSGKSGYARLLKRITRARHREDVLTDVFRDTVSETPTANLSILVGKEKVSVTWPDSTPPELQRMLFYDGACGSAYITTESDFPYRPSALFVMDGLIEVCVRLRSLIDTRLEENRQREAAMPAVVPELKDTDAGRFLNELSGDTSIAALDALIRKLGGSRETIATLRDREARLRSSDTSGERQRFTRQADKLADLHRHIEGLQEALSSAGLNKLQQQRDELKNLESAASILTKSFDEEPLPGVGTSPWKMLWEAAKRFSEEHAYPAQSFPFVEMDSRCVLCQQALPEDGRERLARFDSFVKNDTQVRLKESRRQFEAKREGLIRLSILPEVTENSLKDLQASHAELVSEIRSLLDKYAGSREHTIAAIESERAIPVQALNIDPTVVLVRLLQESKTAKESAETLSDPESAREHLVAITRKRLELELLTEIENSRETIEKEITRRQELQALEAAKSAATTAPITKKINELSEESITEIIRDTFTRETDRLCLERVTINRTKAERGALFHQPKLVGTRQTVTLPRVFSEGERTALGLAAFFTEAHLDASKSALILDDPVTSLDHVRRGLVANRLTTLAETRQIVVFTHDVSFVADLKREANSKGVPTTERSVERSRAGERKPGTCVTGHPWKAKDVSERLDELRKRLARIKKDQSTSDQQAYEEQVASWAGSLSETWERIFSQEIVGQILAEGGLEVRPMMVKVLARFSNDDYREFNASYSRVSQWAKRHDKSAATNYVAPEPDLLENELQKVEAWFKRVKSYKA